MLNGFQPSTVSTCCLKSFLHLRALRRARAVLVPSFAPTLAATKMTPGSEGDLLLAPAPGWGCGACAGRDHLRNTPKPQSLRAPKCPKHVTDCHWCTGRTTVDSLWMAIFCPVPRLQVHTTQAKTSSRGVYRTLHGTATGTADCHILPILLPISLGGPLGLWGFQILYSQLCLGK